MRLCSGVDLSTIRDALRIRRLEVRVLSGARCLRQQHDEADPPTGRVGFVVSAGQALLVTGRHHVSPSSSELGRCICKSIVMTSKIIFGPCQLWRQLWACWTLARAVAVTSGEREERKTYA